MEERLIWYQQALLSYVQIMLRLGSFCGGKWILYSKIYALNF